MNRNFILVKLDSNGKADGNFGNSGSAESPLPENNSCTMQDIVEMKNGDLTTYDCWKTAFLFRYIKKIIREPMFLLSDISLKNKCIHD